MYDFAYDVNSEIFLEQWNDNSIVTVVTNFSTLEPFFDVKRRVKDKIKEKTPNLINSYNKHMGGVDHHNWLAELHSLKTCEKKVVMASFIRSLDMAMVNTWIIHKNPNEDEVLNSKGF
ncbi:DDE_Tnp_1_7 domain-containing protein [Trichonephila clavipes]|nr:DDE_Tnp_1_7 domain-containing protein [Trichonephila clavipes]